MLCQKRGVQVDKYIHEAEADKSLSTYASKIEALIIWVSS